MVGGIKARIGIDTAIARAHAGSLTWITIATTVRFIASILLTQVIALVISGVVGCILIYRSCLLLLLLSLDIGTGKSYCR